MFCLAVKKTKQRAKNESVMSDRTRTRTDVSDGCLGSEESAIFGKQLMRFLLESTKP